MMTSPAVVSSVLVATRAAAGAVLLGVAPLGIVPAFGRGGGGTAALTGWSIIAMVASAAALEAAGVS